MFQFDKIIKLVKNKISEQLPGYQAHKQMLPESRVYKSFEPSAKNSAVLLLIFPKEQNETYFVLVKRVNDGSVHSNQISLPGGKYENKDKNLMFTAIRETYEEIGILIPENQIIGRLSSIYVPVSNFNIFPFVGFLTEKPNFKINLDEIQKLYEIKLADFFNFKIVKKTFFSKNKPFLAPAFTLNSSEYIWGATAMILAEFKFLLQNYLNEETV